MEQLKLTGRALHCLPMHAETLDCMDFGNPGNLGIVKSLNKNTVCQLAAHSTCNFFFFFDPREICQWMLADKNKPLIYRA